MKKPARSTATPLAAPTVTLRSRTLTTWNVKATSARRSSAAKRSARTTRALTTTPRCTTLTPSSASTLAAPPTCAATEVGLEYAKFELLSCVYMILSRGNTEMTDWPVV